MNLKVGPPYICTAIVSNAVADSAQRVTLVLTAIGNKASGLKAVPARGEKTFPTRPKDDLHELQDSAMINLHATAPRYNWANAC